MKTISRAAFLLSLLVLSAPAWAAEEPATNPADEAAEPAAATEAKPAAMTAAERQQQQQALVVEGAPLGNANVGVHIVERKTFTNAGHHEIVLYPATAQLNGKFTRHVGVAATYSYHLFENLALQVTPLFNYYNRESSFNEDLITNGRQQAQAATALLLQWGAVGGVEVTPVYGKFAFYDGVLGHFSFVLSAGAGMGSTRVQLTAKTNSSDAMFGSTGTKFVGSVGAGFRVMLGERAAIRLEVRDLVYTARVDAVDGCTVSDLDAIDNKGSPSGDCQTGKYQDKFKRTNAKLLLGETSSDVLNNISLYTGFSLLF